MTKRTAAALQKVAESTNNGYGDEQIRDLNFSNINGKYPSSLNIIV
jgi:hypothetical protein